jgi:hypothetical protein
VSEGKLLTNFPEADGRKDRNGSEVTVHRRIRSSDTDRMTGQPRPLLAFPEADSCVSRAARDFVEVARKALVKTSVDTSPSQQSDPRNQKCNEQEVNTKVQ